MAIQGNELRVAAEGCDDILAFRLLAEGWVSENAETVTFEFPTAVFEALEMDLASGEKKEACRVVGGAGRRHAVVN